ncbi:hypothetical protein LPJ73_002322 [Coemansia sp. RSA 2703]|nr:hypothetical protein LPJ73_002322 [Coemansia sp. RSA 2703]KAJ2366347.1 hypothetical protein IW150_005963 [Coemansia sp. RSA 2607]KAJ2389024.1 hypothetical protein GGI05_003622 [Coemansia sp. RSA 2603]
MVSQNFAILSLAALASVASAVAVPQFGSDDTTFDMGAAMAQANQALEQALGSIDPIFNPNGQNQATSDSIDFVHMWDTNNNFIAGGDTTAAATDDPFNMDGMFSQLNQNAENQLGNINSVFNPSGVKGTPTSSFNMQDAMDQAAESAHNQLSQLLNNPDYLASASKAAASFSAYVHDHPGFLSSLTKNLPQATGGSFANGDLEEPKSGASGLKPFVGAIAAVASFAAYVALF